MSKPGVETPQAPLKEAILSKWVRIQPVALNWAPARLDEVTKTGSKTELPALQCHRRAEKINIEFKINK